jgi:glucoamylase
LEKYRLYVLLAPYLGNRGSGNTAWVGHYKGFPMLFTERDGIALALACSTSWLKRSVGFVGTSDGWQDLLKHKQMAWAYTRAENGNVALTGEVNLRVDKGRFMLALGFGRNSAEAGHRALASLLDDFETARAEYVREWEAWQGMLLPMEEGGKSRHGLYRLSTAVLRTHEAERFPGGIIASLSIPWGFAKGDDNLGGYHLVWPRDLVETAGGLLAAGAKEDVRRVVHYLRTTQESDGNWPQNMWLDGMPYWSGVQMDETAFPILLVDLGQREGALEAGDMTRLWPMVRRAADFLVRNGPVTQEDRWEEDPGYSAFTLAVEVAALLVAADLAELNQKPRTAAYLRETADAWNASIERWTYATGTTLTQQLGVEGYYVRIAPPEVAEAASPIGGFVPIKNRPPGRSTEPADHIVSPDALALVRFGLRAPDDPRIVNTVRAIDALLKVETPYGPAWHRYNDDGYGEHEDGTPFDGSGVGRAWPLLTGERAHYELAAGRLNEAERLLHTMEAFANEGGMIPEQIWDSRDIPDRGLFFGRPSGSAMPLVWAHAEYVKLCRSLHEGRVVDMPPQPVKRYQVENTSSPHVLWGFNLKICNMQAGKILRLQLPASAVVHWSIDGWHTVHDTERQDTTMGVHMVDLPTESLLSGTRVVFTFYWPEAGRWERMDFIVAVN